MDWICEINKLIENETKNLMQRDGFLELREDCKEGYLVTSIIETTEFTEITPSWNSKTNKDNSLEIFIKLRIDGNWTPYISYGIWSTNGYNIGIKEHYEDDFVKSTTDKIFMKNKKYANAVQLKVIFRGKNPRLSLLAFSTDGGDDEPLAGNHLKIIDNVPMISQLASGHKDSNSICSPTSLTMVLKYYGKLLDIEDVTNGTFDTGTELYGNWPQNVAYAGEQGMRAYTKRCKSINAVKNFIAKGIPIVASVCSKEKNQLEGAHSAFPHGHLMVVIGFLIKDNVEYIVVNDPAAKNNDEVRKFYNLEQWIKVWRHYIYVVTKINKGDS